MTALRQRMSEDMKLRGLAANTQRSYLQAVSGLALYYNKSPDQVSDEELRGYFVYLMEERELSRSSCTVALCGIKFLYEHTLKQQWPLLALVRPGKAKRLPVILSRDEVRQVLNEIRLLHCRVCLSLIYACGLRISEGLNVQVGASDSARMQVLIRNSKGNKDRYVPLSDPILMQLRQYW